MAWFNCALAALRLGEDDLSLSELTAIEPVARALIWVETPGVTTADLSTFTFRHRRVPLYPLEPDATR